MKNPLFYYLMIFSVFILGGLTYIINTEFIKNLLVIYMLVIFLILIIKFMILPLCNYIFGILGSRLFTIKRGKNYTSVLPIFKPFFTGDNYEIFITFPHNMFNTGHKFEHVNKLIGFNYGLPIIKKWELVHSNSYRLGYILDNDKIHICLYKKQGFLTSTQKLKTINKDNNILYVKMNSKLGTFTIDGSEISMGKKRHFFNYYLSRPYFGGNPVAPFTFKLNYHILKSK